MADIRPELVFLAGPQAGQRSVIMADVAVAGRSPSAEIPIQELHASREHLRFRITADGWTVENLSSRGMRVNGKKFRAGAKLILATGDVVSIGVATDMLFVSPGDDPEAAVRSFREATAAAAPPVQAPPVQAPPVQVPPVQSPPVGQAAAPPPKTEPIPTEAADERGDQETPEMRQAKARRAKLRKYGVAFAIYAAVMVGVIIFAANRTQETRRQSEVPSYLKEDDIRDALVGDISKQVSSDQAAEDSLAEAVRLFNARRPGGGDLYKCVKYFRLYLAYKGRRAFVETQHEDMFRTAKEQLLREVEDGYDSAKAWEGARDWAKAERAFSRLLLMVPVKSDPEPEEKNLFYDNVMEHLTYVRGQLPQK